MLVPVPEQIVAVPPIENVPGPAETTMPPVIVKGVLVEPPEAWVIVAANPTLWLPTVKVPGTTNVNESVSVPLLAWFAVSTHVNVPPSIFHLEPFQSSLLVRVTLMEMVTVGVAPEQRVTLDPPLI